MRRQFILDENGLTLRHLFKVAHLPGTEEEDFLGGFLCVLGIACKILSALLEDRIGLDRCFPVSSDKTDEHYNKNLASV